MNRIQHQRANHLYDLLANNKINDFKEQCKIGAPICLSNVGNSVLTYAIGLDRVDIVIFLYEECNVQIENDHITESLYKFNLELTSYLLKHKRTKLTNRNLDSYTNILNNCAISSSECETFDKFYKYILRFKKYRNYNESKNR
jgi:hypothetical protein